MLVELAAVAVAGFYAANVPVKLAFLARLNGAGIFGAAGSANSAGSAGGAENSDGTDISGSAGSPGSAGSSGSGTGASLGVAAFEGRFALRSARRKLAERKAPSPRAMRIPRKLMLRVVRRLLPHVRLEYLRASIDIGLSDAAGTAIAAGCVNALLTAVRASSGAHVVCDVRPDFRKACLGGEVAGIVSLPAGHIMLAALKGAMEMSGRNAHGQASD